MQVSLMPSLVVSFCQSKEYMFPCRFPRNHCHLAGNRNIAFSLATDVWALKNHARLRELNLLETSQPAPEAARVGCGVQGLYTKL